MTRVEELKTRIAVASDSYWTYGVSDISDIEYDELVEELKRLTGEEDSIGQPEVLSSGKVQHPIPMLSMQKVYDMAKVVQWVQRYAGQSGIRVMPKYDGVALCVYHRGLVATRGDGKVGENVTDIASIFTANRGYGECVCPLDKFEQFKELGYKNPRNVVSGILNSLDPEIRERARLLEFVRYPDISTTLRHADPDFRYTASCLQTVADEVCFRAGNYPLDGVVFRVADEGLFHRLGHTDHHWRGQIALKFQNKCTDSIVEGITWQEKNGTVTPVAQIAPVTLAGAEISRVTLHNANRVREWNIRVGDGCRIERAGGVIPKIVKTWRNAQSPDCRPTVIPSACPTCGTTLREEGARLYCTRCDK